MKASIAQATVAQLTSGQVDIGQLSVGPIAVGHLVVEGIQFKVRTGTAAFRNLRVTVGLIMNLDYAVDVTIFPIPTPFHWQGTIPLGNQSITFGLGDVTLPGLADFSVNVASLTADHVQATVAPLTNITLGPVTVEQLQARDILAPVPDLQLQGLGLGKITATGLNVPAATTSGLTIAHLTGQRLPMGTVHIPGMSLPEAGADDITAAALDVSGTSNDLKLEAPAGLLTITLRITPSARLQADELRLADVHSSAAITGIELQNVEMPYDVLNLTMGQLGIQTIDIPTIEMS